MAVFVQNSGQGIDTSQSLSLTFRGNTASVSKGYTEGFSKYIYQPTAATSGIIPIFSGTVVMWNSTLTWYQWKLTLGNSGPQNFMEVGFLDFTFLATESGVYWLYDLGQRISICLYLLQQGLIGNTNTRFSQPYCFLSYNGIYKYAIGSYTLYTSQPDSSASAMRVQIISEKSFYLYIPKKIYNGTDSTSVTCSCNLHSFSVGSRMYN